MDLNTQREIEQMQNWWGLGMELNYFKALELTRKKV